MSSHFSYIQPKNSLAKDTEIHRLVEKIMCKVGDIPRHQEYKHNLEMLKMLCVMVEHGIDNTGRKDKAKTDKKDVVFQVITRMWANTTPAELKSIDSNIQFLWENGFIARRSRWKVIKHSICDWIHRKILN